MTSFLSILNAVGALMMALNGDVTALSQVWVFIVAPLVGAALAAVVFETLKAAK